MKGNETEEKNDQEINKPNKAEFEKPIKSAQQNKSGQKQATKTIIVKTVKQGAGVVSRAGDFIGRLGTLIVMIVTSINTGTIMVTSFLEEVYWKGVVHAALLAFIHIPMIIVMIWFMCKARMQSLYRKVRPSRPGEAIIVTDVENESVVYEETIEVMEEASNNSDEMVNKKNVSEKVLASSKEAERINQLKTEEKLKNRLKTAEHINKAFNLS